MNGFLNILKPCGMSSSDAVFRVRRTLGVKTCGHMGTLDPGAAGVLPIGVGRATRLFDYLLGKEKSYRAVFRFGAETDTLDSYGKVLRTGGRIPGIEEVERALPSLCGRVLQTAPLFSAKKINGRKGYELARSEIAYEPPKKEVDIFSIDFLGESGGRFEFDIACGGGTYIRSIARDLAEKLGTFAVMESLIRTRVGLFSIEDSVTLDELEQTVKTGGTVPWVLPETVLADYPVLEIPDDFYERLKNGLPFPAEETGEVFYRVRCRGEFFGMGRLCEDGFRIKTRINTEDKES